MNQAFDSYSRNPSDFGRAKEECWDFVSREIEGGHGRKEVLSEFQMVDHCRSMYHFLTSFGIAFFVKIVLDVLISAGIQFGYWRDGKRSFFWGLRLKGSVPNRFEEPGRQENFSSFPQENRDRNSDSMNPCNDDFSDSLGNDFSYSKPVNRVVSRETDLDEDDDSSDDADASKSWLEDYTQRDPSQKLAVAKVKKLFMAVVTDESQIFNDFLDKFMTDNKDLSIVEEPGKSGKPRRYIVGLTLSDKGKAKLEG